MDRGCGEREGITVSGATVSSGWRVGVSVAVGVTGDAVAGGEVAGWQEESKTKNVRQKRRRDWRMGKSLRLHCNFSEFKFFPGVWHGQEAVITRSRSSIGDLNYAG